MEEKDDKNEQFEEMDKDETKKDEKKTSLNKTSVFYFLLLALSIILIVILFKYFNYSKNEQTILDINPNTKFLVTLGSSNLGGYVLQYLLEKNVPPKNIITTVRNMQKGEKWKEKGIEVRIADYTDPESLEKAFKGVDRIYMVSSVGTIESPRQIQHSNVIKAAKTCGVKLIVYSSFVNCLNNTNMVAVDHKDTEKILEESGLNYSIARNAIYLNLYGELLKFLAKKENDYFYNSCGDTKISLVTIRELGEAGASILLKKENKKIYELSGNPISFIDIKNAMEKLTGKEIKIIDVSHKEFTQYYEELMFNPYFCSLGIYMHQDFANGIFDIHSKDLENLIGHPPASLENNIKEVIELPDYYN